MAVGGAYARHVAAVRLLLAGETQVVAGIGILGPAPVGADEGAVEDDMGPAGGLAGLEHRVQVRGGRGEHVDALVQIPAAGCGGHPGIAGQGGHAGVLPEPAQHQQRLGGGRGGARAHARFAANHSWCALVARAADLTACMPTLALTGHDARRWEPKRLRRRLFSSPARYARTGRRRLLHLAATAPFTALVLHALAALARLTAPPPRAAAG